jgi:hypothetical protein
MSDESPYIGKIKDELVEPDFRHIHDLEMLRAIIRQSERSGVTVQAVRGLMNATSI